MKNIALIGAALLAGPGFAHADDATTVLAPSPFVEQVNYQAPDLTSDSGVRDLRTRVRRAAHRVCQPTQNTFMPTYNELTCFSPTVRDAFAQVDQAVARWRSGVQASTGSITIRAR